MYLTHEQQVRIAGQIMAQLVHINMDAPDLEMAARKAAQGAQALTDELKKESKRPRAPRFPNSIR